MCLKSKRFSSLMDIRVIKLYLNYQFRPPPILVASGSIMLDFVLTIFPIQGTYFYALGR